ncbi:MAG TPA: 3'(2'),5'-bisphosphate nucleotidase CysQ [Rhizomicrobium sp.]|nr:3'(2'),5'-bisphosphate nucleotidase CysQ [Rhizomicrobium sp.]
MPESDLALLERTVREAGAIAREIYERPHKTWSKQDGSPVTEADIAVNRFLSKNLRSARPDYAWLSEESEDDPTRFSARRVFVVDPIDGTLAFVRRRPHFTVSAAVVDQGEPVAGAVYNPITEECFAAVKGEGARLNGVPIRASACKEVAGCRLLASKATLRNPRWQSWPEMHVEVPNSIAYRVSLVASGAFDAAITMVATHDWDIAAADIIVREAGGVITSLEGEPPRYNLPQAVQPSVLAAGPALHAALRARLTG